MIKQPKRVLGAKAADSNAAMDSLVRLLGVRERSVQEAQGRLAEKGYCESASSQAIERALACGLLDDERFAKVLIKSKLSAGWGRHRVEQALYRFGIDKESIPGYPDEFFAEEEQLERALAALKRHRSHAKNPRQAAYRYLVSKGYSSQVASVAVRAVDAGLSDQ